MSQGRGFFYELQRRHVVRVAIAYAVAAWVLLQLASIVFPAFGAPDWVLRIVIAVLALGFPLALVLAWAFELTPTGLRRTEPEQSPDARTHEEQRGVGRALNALVIGVLVVAVIVLLLRQFGPFGREAKPADAAAAPGKSIAVLPFANMSGDAKNEWFSDGITEEILNALAQVPGLKVAARTSAFAFKGKEPDLRKVGEVLGVATVLDGSVQRDGDDVRISVHLSDVRSGYHLWSETYDRKLTRVFAIEDEIAKAIAARLEVQFAGSGGGVDKTGDARAHELYLRGLPLLAARGPGLREAVDLFGEAVRIDPRYAQAWGALAQAEQLLPGYVQSVDRGQANLRAEAAAQRALAIDPDAPAALVAMAEVHMHRNEWAPADASFRRAVALAPSDGEAVNQYGQFLFEVGQLAPALQMIERAGEIDPLSPIIPTIRAGILMGLGREAEGTAQLDAVNAAHPDFYPGRVTAAFYDLRLRRFADAEAQFRQVARIIGADPEAKAILARGVADAAQRAAALQSLATSPANADFRSDQLVEAALCVALGEHERAFALLQAFATQRASSATGMLWTGVFDPLRADPRFASMLASMKLPYRRAETP
jgi:TolB-like protein/Tfp pilus assembly protein PilF